MLNFARNLITSRFVGEFRVPFLLYYTKGAGNIEYGDIENGDIEKTVTSKTGTSKITSKMVTSKIIPQNRSRCWEPKLGTLTLIELTKIPQY